MFENKQLIWELLFRLLSKSQGAAHHSLSFPQNQRYFLSDEDLSILHRKNARERELFSELIHAMPDGSFFRLSEESLFEAYEKVFIGAEIADQPYLESEWKTYQEKYPEEINIYDSFKNQAENLEEEWFKLVESKALPLEMERARKKIQEHQLKWKLNGYKDFVEEKINSVIAEGEFSFANQWTQWKSRAQNSWSAGTNGPFSRFGNFSTDFDRILSIENWTQWTFDKNDLEEIITDTVINQRVEVELLEILLKKMKTLRFKTSYLPIRRDWFEPELFKADFWKWKEGFPVSWASDGNFGGFIPTYISGLILMRDIEFRYQSNMMADVLEWIGGLFRELPFFPLMEESSNGQYIAAFEYQLVARSPNPNPGLTF
ncbi:MAG: hypothetical protein AAFY71_09830 [Bacteroidota bacterium]